MLNWNVDLLKQRLENRGVMTVNLEIVKLVRKLYERRERRGFIRVFRHYAPFGGGSEKGHICLGAGILKQRRWQCHGLRA